MQLTSSYLVTTKNLEGFFDSLIGAKAPEIFTNKFIENLGFTSSNDRLFLAVLKGLGFLDENATPTERYYRFLDQSESKKVLAEAVEEAYAELFNVKTDAHKMDVSDVKNKLKTITQGKYSDTVVGLMAKTFKALCDYAEWQTSTGQADQVTEKVIKEVKTSSIKVEDSHNKFVKKSDDSQIVNNSYSDNSKPDFHYNIQIHLPDSRDEAVYDAIFKSLKKHLF